MLNISNADSLFLISIAKQSALLRATTILIAAFLP